MFAGFIPGSVGETSTLLIAIGAIILNLYENWKLENHVKCSIGALVMGLIFNGVVDQDGLEKEANFTINEYEFWHHLLIGGFAFGSCVYGNRSRYGITNK